MSETHAPRYRPLRFGVTRVDLRDGPDGVRYVRADQPLQDYAARITDRLLHWAECAPQRSFMAQRVRNPDGTRGDWRHIGYAQALDSARRIGQALLDRGLSTERPVVILSENDLEHALLALGCLYAGVPYCPASPAYATISQDFAKLRHVLGTLTPGLVFASDAQRYGHAILATVGEDVEVVTTGVPCPAASPPASSNCWTPKPRRRWTPPCGPPAPTRSPSSCSPRGRPKTRRP